MNKNSTILGIDISKSTFDVYSEVTGHDQFENNEKGFKAFLKILPKESWVVMEATGSYHHNGLLFFDKGVCVSVVNPLVVNLLFKLSSIGSKLTRASTDHLPLWATQELEPWRPDPQYVAHCKEIQGLVQSISSSGPLLKNKLHSLQSKGLISGRVITCLKRQLGIWITKSLFWKRKWRR